MAEMRTIAGVDLEIEERGAGRPLLLLHAGEGLGRERQWIDLMARTHRVMAPHHPGFGRSALPDWIGTVDDLAYLYLDLAAKLDLRDAVLVGASFGGWVAAEMMVRATARFSRLILVSPLGIKVRGRDDRDIADMHAMAHDAYLAAAYADPSRGRIDTGKLSDIELAAIVRGREALTLFGWRPYMHNPRLKSWLHRIDIPTLILRGDKDRIIAPYYVEGWQSAIPGARLESIRNCGHFPLCEQPQDVAQLLAGDGAD